MKQYLFVAIFLLACLGQAAVLPDQDGIPFERFHQFPLISGRAPSSPAMSPDGTLIVFGWNQTGERKLDVWTLRFPGGEKECILRADSIERLPRQDDQRTDDEKRDEDRYDGGISGFKWASDGKEFMFQYRGRVWFCDRKGKNLRPMFDTSEAVGSPAYSPDGKYIGFIRSGNLFRYDRLSGHVKQLTFISKAGTSVTFFAWAPDSKSIAVTWSDTSKEGKGLMMNYTKQRAETVSISRMWHGEQSINRQVGVVASDGGLINFISDIPSYHWLLSLDWAPDSSRIAIGWKSKDHQEYTVTTYEPALKRTLRIYHEKAPKNKMNDWRPIAWARDSKSFYLGTDIVDGKFSWRTLVQISRFGKTMRSVYAEKHDIIDVSRPKDSDRLILTTQSRSPLESEVTIIEPSGKRVVHRPLGEQVSGMTVNPGSGQPLYSDDGKMIACLASNKQVSRELYAVEPKIARLTSSQLPEFKQIRWADRKEVTFKGPDGTLIHGELLTRPGLDLTKKHPALISSMYADSAKADWNGFFENYLAMALDLVVLKIDFRASYGYGGEFQSGYYQQMGIIDAGEAVCGKNFLVSLGYVNPDRCGLWGWSYGGFLTCMTMFTHPSEFYAGVAVAPVADWKSYNEWYTWQRLGLAKDNEDVYKKTSPINFVSGLKNNLKLIHGVMDDNVLFQDTVQLVNKLIEENKHFELMIYPRDNHGISRIESQPHVYVEIVEYLNRKLKE